MVFRISVSNQYLEKLFICNSVFLCFRHKSNVLRFTSQHCGIVKSYYNTTFQYFHICFPHTQEIIFRKRISSQLNSAEWTAWTEEYKFDEQKDMWCFRVSEKTFFSYYRIESSVLLFLHWQASFLLLHCLELYCMSWSKIFVSLWLLSFPKISFARCIHSLLVTLSNISEFI